MQQISRICITTLLFLNFVVVVKSQTISPVDITIDRDGVLLQGKFYLTGGTGFFPTVLLLHGLPGNEKDVLGLGNELSQAGMNVLTFNYSGTYKSQGENNFENTQKDIAAAFHFISQPENVDKYKTDTTKTYLGGWSYGGGMALTYAANHPGIKDVFSIAGTDHGEFFREYFRNPEFKQMIDAMFEALKAPSGPVRFPEGGMPKDVTEQMLTEADSTIDLRKCAPILAQKNILLVGALDDAMVTMEHHILPLYRTLQKHKAPSVKMATFQDNHAFSISRTELAKMINGWIKAASGKKKKP